LWLAGQRWDPGHYSPFVWRETYTDPNREKVTIMNYTYWDPSSPDNMHHNESCVNVWTGYNYKWNDYPCTKKLCSLCEIDYRP